jgi:hypothetical protein
MKPIWHVKLDSDPPVWFKFKHLELPIPVSASMVSKAGAGKLRSCPFQKTSGTHSSPGEAAKIVRVQDRAGRATAG